MNRGFLKINLEIDEKIRTYEEVLDISVVRWYNINEIR